jgi:hypothetical protein
MARSSIEVRISPTTGPHLTYPSGGRGAAYFGNGPRIGAAALLASIHDPIGNPLK